MTRRRRSPKRRPLAEFAERSWMHAAAVGAFRIVLLACLALVVYLVIMNLLVPNMIDGLMDRFGSPSQ